MWIGSRTPPAKAGQWADDVQGHLLEGEVLLGAVRCALVRPHRHDGLLVTSHRLLAFRGSRLKANGPVVALALDDVDDVQVTSTPTSFNELQALVGAAAGVAGAGGSVERLGDVAKQDLVEVRQLIGEALAARRSGSPSPARHAAAPADPAVAPVPAVEAPRPAVPASTERAPASHGAFGRGVRDSKARRLRDVAPHLAAGEHARHVVEAWGLNPRSDALVVTELRVLGLMGQRLVWELKHVDTFSVRATEPEAVTFTAIRGGARIFKGVEAPDRDAVVEACAAARDVLVPTPPPAPVTAPAAEPSPPAPPARPAPSDPPAPPPVFDAGPPAPAPAPPPPPAPAPAPPPPPPPPRRVEPAPAPLSTGTSLADEIRKLAVLRDEGILDDDEFALAKRRLIEG